MRNTGMDLAELIAAVRREDEHQKRRRRQIGLVPGEVERPTASFDMAQAPWRGGRP
jgi:hypothetical protein